MSSNPHEPVQVLPNVLRGAAIGGGIAYALHHARQANASRQALEDIRDLLQAEQESTISCRLDEQISDLWRPAAESVALQLGYLTRVRQDDDFAAENFNLVERWSNICRRCEARGLCPLVAMPRSVSGDIVGTPRVLDSVMSRIEHRLDLIDREEEIGARYVG